MKKILSLVIAVIFLMASFSACGTKNTATNDKDNAKDNSGKLKVVTTIFPEYDWVREILGDKAKDADLTMLLDNGVDLHSYQPNAEDISKISDCDLFIYVGGESDGWVKDALKEATNPNMKVINLLDTLGDTVREEEVKEGMEPDEDEDHDHHDGDKEDAEHHDSDAKDTKNNDSDAEEPEYDEHVWLSLKNAKVLCDAIEEALASLDKDNADTYKANLESYKEKLDNLDKEYKDTVDNASVKTVLFGDRFPFRYMVDDYGLDYYAAFVGCSAETEASFKTVKFLAEKVDELGLKSVLTIEGPNHKIAETIVKNTKTKDQQILSLDSMQSTDSKQIKDGVTYLSVMTDNLKVLKSALK